jgi:hypothetical protein
MLGVRAFRAFARMGARYRGKGKAGPVGTPRDLVKRSCASAQPDCSARAWRRGRRAPVSTLDGYVTAVPRRVTSPVS